MTRAAPWRAAAAVVGAVVVIGVTTGCAADDPFDPSTAVFRVSIDLCGPNDEARATAVSIGDGLALTAAHSFEDAEAIVMIDAEGTEVSADVVHLDVERDLGLLSFEEGLVAAGAVDGLSVHSDADEPADRAELVVARDSTLVSIPVDLLRRTQITLDGEGRRAGIELAGTIEPGDSGAPVLDERNRIIGLVFAASRTGESGWAVAASEFLDVRDRAGAPLPLTCP